MSTTSTLVPLAKRTDPSPSAKAAALPRKAASTTNASKEKSSLIGIASGQTRLEAGLQHFFIEIATDENEPAVAFLIIPPGALVIALDEHMDTLDDIALVIVLEGKNSLQAKYVRADFLGYLGYPWKEESRVKFTRSQ